MTRVITVRQTPPLVIDVSQLHFDAIGSLTPDQMHRQRVAIGIQSSELGQWVRVSGDPADGCLVIEGDCRRLAGIGTEHAEGQIVVDGDAGPWAGRRMRGGTLEIRGSAGAFAGSGMRGGRLIIGGDAGHRLAGPATGERTGMRGGTVTVGGNVGPQAGHRMRRGLVWIGGATAEGCGFEMIAGTIVAGRVAERHLGCAMRRGTIVCLSRPDTATPVYRERMFTEPYPAPPVFMALLQSSLADMAEPDACLEILQAPYWQRAMGDMSVGGLGEILFPGE